ncbi:hypothetical protein M1O19_06995 [Dehalococcoidia bacterium]|nr:hypothetical protein [Dehalococcoidia bacterium]MCL0098232.1 hypothetical protein [Dehalococcoidia bacterium]
MIGRNVYHASETQGLTLLKPSVGTHRERWVYATKDIVMAALFLSGKGGDLTCAVGRDGDIPYVCERFVGAFDYRYANVSGSIYVLPSETFMENKTQWDEEVVSESEVTPAEEIRIDDVKGFLIEQSNNGRLKILFYPNRTADIPGDDEDLVYRGIIWTRKMGEPLLEDFRKYHPHLISRIQKGLEENRYLNDDFYAERK